jgi:serine/threonine protein kinase
VKRHPLSAGAVIASGYEVIAHLSRGRRLDVYDAWDRRRGTRCVVKALRPERLDDAHARERLLEEGRLLQRLSHPHLVRGYETVAVPQPLVIMETLGGQTLGHMIDTEGRLSAPDAAQLGLQLGSAVRYLHANGVLHLDMKPSNVVAEAGRAKLIDLSVARPPGRAPAGVGTPLYMAPEQASGGVLGPAADVWGIGAVLFEATVGEAPFDDPSVDGTDDGSSGGSSSLESYTGPWLQLERPAGRVDELAGVPHALADVVAACLEPAPGDRPGIIELLGRLERLSEMPEGEWRWQRETRSGEPPPAGDDGSPVTESVSARYSRAH